MEAEALAALPPAMANGGDAITGAKMYAPFPSCVTCVPSALETMRDVC